MWKKIEKLFRRGTSDFSMSSKLEYLSSTSPQLADMPAEWVKPWEIAVAEASALFPLSPSELKDFPEERHFSIGSEPTNFSGCIEHEIFLNGEHRIAVTVKSDKLICGKSAITASLAVSIEGEKRVQPRPMWSGPNDEGFSKWVHGYKPAGSKG